MFLSNKSFLCKKASIVAKFSIPNFPALNSLSGTEIKHLISIGFSKTLFTASSYTSCISDYTSDIAK